MKYGGDNIAKGILMVVAFSALTSLLLIAVFVVKEGLPFILKTGMSNFLFSSEWDPGNGKYGIYSMIVSRMG